MSTSHESKARKVRPAPFMEQTPCYCIRLRRAAGMMTDYYDTLLRPLGITVNQFSLLITLKYCEGSGTGELARHLGLEKSTLVRSMQPLLKASLIEDTAPDASRTHHWRLTDTGKDLVEEAKPVWNKAQGSVRAALEGNPCHLFEILQGLDALIPKI